MKRKYLHLNIKGQEWKVFVQTHSSYKRMHGSDSAAICYPDDREMYFDRSTVSLKLIRHEVFHAFISSTDTENSSGMTAADQEEVDCTVYGNNKTALNDIEDRIIEYILRGE